MNEGIIQIPVDKIWQHPDNPRKDLGDLTELTASIKANGILQNLTVVPLIGEISEKWDGESYRCLIGHRRLAAAKKAGLATVPCVVADLTEKEQLRVMMMENMQRADLTVLEQARGFQLMLDFGDTVPEIAEGTGFSESTVRRRLELAQVDKLKPKATEAAFQRGATLEDFAEVQKISDPADRAELLEVMGTANFRSRLATAKEKEKFRERAARWRKTLDTFAKEDPGCHNRADVSYVRNYTYWHPQDTEVTVPEDAGEAIYLYRVSERQIDLYRVRSEAENDERAAEHRREEEQQRRNQARLDNMAAATALQYQLRRSFVQKLTQQECSYAAEWITEFTADVMTKMHQGNWAYPELDVEAFAAVMGLANLDEEDVSKLEDDDAWFSDDPLLHNAVWSRRPLKALLALAWSTADSPRTGYARAVWQADRRFIRHEENRMLDEIYKLLKGLGYEMSDEEKALQDGSHEIFREDAE